MVSKAVAWDRREPEGTGDEPSFGSGNAVGAGLVAATGSRSMTVLRGSLFTDG
jgi:hypothetical protein